MIMSSKMIKKPRPYFLDYLESLELILAIMPSELGHSTPLSPYDT